MIVLIQYNISTIVGQSSFLLSLSLPVSVSVLLIESVLVPVHVPFILSVPVLFILPVTVLVLVPLICNVPVSVFYYS